MGWCAGTARRPRIGPAAAIRGLACISSGHALSRLRCCTKLRVRGVAGFGRKTSGESGVTCRPAATGRCTSPSPSLRRWEPTTRLAYAHQARSGHGTMQACRSTPRRTTAAGHPMQCCGPDPASVLTHPGYSPDHCGDVGCGAVIDQPATGKGRPGAAHPVEVRLGQDEQHG